MYSNFHDDVAERFSIYASINGLVLNVPSPECRMRTRESPILGASWWHKLADSIAASLDSSKLTLQIKVHSGL